MKQHRKSPQSSTITEKEITESIGAKDKEAFQLLHGYSSHALNKSGYNWVSGQFFQTLFGLQRQWNQLWCVGDQMTDAIIILIVEAEIFLCILN